MSIADDLTGGTTQPPLQQPQGQPPPPPPPPPVEPVEPDPPLIRVLPTNMNPVALSIIGKRAKRLRDEMGTATGKDKQSNKSLRTAYDSAAKREKMPPPKDMDRGSAKTAKGVPKEVSKVGTKRSLQTVSEDHEMELAGGITYAGKWMEEGRASGARPKVGDRDLQLLNQLSVLLFNAVSAETGTQEIESMAVNGRVVVSANEEATVARIQGLALDELLLKAASGKIGDTAIGLVAKEKDFSDRERSGMNRLSAMEMDTAELPDQAQSVQAVLETLHKTMAEKTAIIDGGSPEAVAGHITDPGSARRVITVDAWDGTEVSCSHAEQNLLYALVLSGYKGKASIAGKKRPCTACWISLMLVRRAGYDITFNLRPGGYWDNTTYQGLQRIAAKLGFTSESSLLAQVKDMAGADSDFTQYVTSVVGTDPETADVRLLEALKEGSHYVSDISTPDLSPTYDYPPTPPPAPRAPEVSIAYVGLAAGATPEPDEPSSARLALAFGVQTIGTNIDNDLVLGNGTTAEHAADVWLDDGQAKLKLLTAAGTSVTRGGSPAPGVKDAVYDLATGDRFQVGPYIWVVETDA